MCQGPMQTPPGYGPTLLPPTQTYGNTGIPGPRPWTSVPYMQTYGGQQAPWADLGTQILDAWNMGQNGAGRFGANAAQRYSFAGPWQWQQDVRPGAPQSPGIVPKQAQPADSAPDFMARQAQPAAGRAADAAAFTHQGPGTGLAGMPKQGGGLLTQPGASYGIQQPAQNPVAKQQAAPNPMQGFQQLLAEDPRAASEALNFNPGWFQANQGALAGMVPGGDLGAWRNSTQPGASNVGAITDEQRALIRKRMGW